jgi:hypothetical protein
LIVELLSSNSIPIAVNELDATASENCITRDPSSIDRSKCNRVGLFLSSIYERTPNALMPLITAFTSLLFISNMASEDIVKNVLALDSAICLTRIAFTSSGFMIKTTVTSSIVEEDNGGLN